MPAEPLALLPMLIRIGDRFLDESGEWEVVTHPAVSHGGKALRARAQHPGDPASAREMFRAAHERIAVLRGAPAGEPRSAPPCRPLGKRPSRRRK